MSMSDEPKFVQSVPGKDSGSSSSSVEQKVMEARIGARSSGFGGQLSASSIEDDANTFINWLVRYPVERNHPRPTTGTINVQKSGDAVVCTSNDRVVDVLEKLVTEGFLSMPIVSSSSHQLVGYVDMLDLVWFILSNFGAWREEVSKETVVESREHFTNFLSQERFKNATILDVMAKPSFGIRNQPHYIMKGFSLFHVVETMARIGTHRVAICNAERHVIGIITQSMVISLFDQHMVDQLGTLLTNHTVGEMVPGLLDQLKLVNDTDLALTAFKEMTRARVNGLAVVDASGVLVDTVSVRDLRGLGHTAENWSALWLNVKDFKAHCRSKFAAQTPVVPLYATKDQPLSDLLKKMDDGNIHRIWLCEARTDGKPVPTHCISQRDVLRFLLHLAGLKYTTVEDLENA